MFNMMRLDQSHLLINLSCSKSILLAVVIVSKVHCRQLLCCLYLLLEGIQSEDAGTLRCLKPGNDDSPAELKLVVQGSPSYCLYLVLPVFCN